jgi:signal transduction histidine kinase/ligand-binding sensor domain-containing protein
MKKIFWAFGIQLFFASCSGKKPLDLSNNSTQERQAIEITVLANLPDSVQPKVVFLNTAPVPSKVLLSDLGAIQKNYIDGSGQTQLRNLTPATVQLLSQLTDENDKLIRDYNGNPFLQGEGGISQFKNYSSDNGLTLDAINCGIIDQRGHLWFGTNSGGVSRFDGETFTTYSTVEGLADNIVRTIFEDSNGIIWFGTIGWGISSFDGYSFTSYSTTDGLVNDYVYGIAEDDAGNIWFGTGGGLSRFDGEEFTNFTTAEGLPSNEIVSVVKGPNGLIWIGTENNGVFTYDGKIFKGYTTADGLPSNRIRSITVDSLNRILFGTIGGGVGIFDGKKFTSITTEDGLPSMLVKHVLEDQFGKIWFATDNGVGRLDGNKVTSYGRNQGLSSNNINYIIEDREGKLWFCTEGGGVSRFDGNSFTNFTASQGLADNFVMTILEDLDGTFWFGTSGGGISHYDGKSFSNFGISQGLPNDLVNSSMLDKDGNIWFGTGGGGVTLYDRKSFTTYTTAQGLPSSEIYSILQAKDGIIWFGTDGGGVSRFDGKSFTNYSYDQGLAGDAIIGMAEDIVGSLWFAAADGGLTRFDGKSFVNFYDIHGLGDSGVLKVVSDKQGNLWVATINGLSFLSVSKLKELDKILADQDADLSGLFQTFRTSDGLPDNVILQISDFPGARIAVGTNLGIVLFDAPKNAHFQSLTTIEIFNSETGYPVKDLTDGQNAMYVDSKGILWAGTGNNKTALVRFDYSALRKNQRQPELLFKQLRLNEEVISWQRIFKKGTDSSARDLEELLVYGKILSETESTTFQDRFENVEIDSIQSFFPIPEGLVLPYQHNHINIDYGTNELSNPSLIEYQYILEGYDAEWSPVLKKTSATFGNIQEGEYTFKVKARYTGPSSAVAAEWTEPISYNFSVLPPWYRTWWAYTIYVTGFLTLIYPLTIYNKNQAIKAEKVKAQDRELAHAKEIEKAYKNLKSTQSQLIQAEKMASLGELTAGIAHEIQNPLNFVNNFSEVSSELILEMNEDLEKGRLDDAKIIAEDIRQNLDRITMYGRRADSIVKAMLQHSRSGIGQKEKTDINAISEECLRLSYHGIRAKDKEFHAEYLTNLDPEVPQLNVIPRDIRTVLLNIYNNAFYSVSEYDKGLRNGGEKKPEDEYTPVVRVTTTKLAKGLEIRISDNGKGIPSTIKSKVFQPFFTTKPTGNGTGLGLSLSYDIIKAHGGDLTIESPPTSGQSELRQGAEFIIFLPFE